MINQNNYPTELNASSEFESLLNKSAFKTYKSNTPLSKLKQNVLYGLYIAVIITIGYVAIILKFHIWQVQLSMLILIIFNTWIMSGGVELYREINLQPDAQSLLHELKRTHTLFTRWIKEQNKAAILVYPIAAAGGFILGGVVGSNKTADEFLSKPFVWIALLITIAILIPISIWLAKKMNQLAFGKYLDQIKHQIIELEQE